MPDAERERPLLPIRNLVIYPGMVAPVAVERQAALRLVEALGDERQEIAVVAQREDRDDITARDLFEVGVTANVHHVLPMPDGFRLLLQGVERVRLERVTATHPFWRARLASAPENIQPSERLEALMRSNRDLFTRLVGMVPFLSQDLVATAVAVSDPLHLAYLIGAHVPFRLHEQQAILERDGALAKHEELAVLLGREIALQELGRQIQNDVQESLGKGQRELLLREQLAAIRRELGEDQEADQFKDKLKTLHLPPEVRQEVEREVQRLERMPPATAEFAVIRSYVEWVCRLPWQCFTQDRIDLEQARRVLDGDHHGQEKVKQRILEQLAVIQRGQKAGKPMRGPLLCLVGPPGVGKTSLGQSIAKAMGRHFVRMSLGGIKDESEIRGHRRTYVGAMPGRILQALARGGSANPVFVLDEIDKLCVSFQGDPAAALLEVLDSQQNSDFRDHYLDLPFDLSQVLFLTTANHLDHIPAPLLDRLEVVEISGYTLEEKLQIAKRHLIPRQLSEHLQSEDWPLLEPNALVRLVEGYTREAGVRQLERHLGALCRKLTMEPDRQSPFRESDLARLLGGPRFRKDPPRTAGMPGIALGLGWTPYGGEVLHVETQKLPGRKRLILTGQLGEVMRESVQTALTHVLAMGPRLGLTAEDAQTEIHVHVPAGAIAKDGPSAGVAIVLALASLLTDHPLHSDVAMTGEVTLSGAVLPVGGIREKVLAADRAGLKRVILPRQNEADLEELPVEVTKRLCFILIERVAEAFPHAFGQDRHPLRRHA